MIWFLTVITFIGIFATILYIVFLRGAENYEINTGDYIYIEGIEYQIHRISPDRRTIQLDKHLPIRLAHDQ